MAFGAELTVGGGCWFGEAQADVHHFDQGLGADAVPVETASGSVSVVTAAAAGGRKIRIRRTSVEPALSRSYDRPCRSKHGTDGCTNGEAAPVLITNDGT
jgi:hypothetical protein